ncbi:3'-5' exoribonuclease [Actinoallomurus purpureus]|uniref:3'-5' exoribonuclease domain-containing protein n=1 Tax=Actinoallomurus purpureus TaxID=478114 RepID=UPI0020931A60|nr:3'-5' exoribonuclease [Actinoallomurus purpureus]MCO6011538.1 3'-5' exoribonuclease [Actinoallomurus purpureus]
MRIYMDWEFLEDGETIAPISVALVREDGREYYAVNADMPWSRIMRHDWLRANVVPSLPIVKHDGIRPFRKPFLDRTHPDVKHIDQIAAEVHRFIVDTPSVELWGWYSAYDHVCLAWLYGPMSDLPTGIPMWTNDVRQEHLRLGEPQMPEQESGVHNALADARHIKVMAEFLADHERKAA